MDLFTIGGIDMADRTDETPQHSKRKPAGQIIDLESTIGNDNDSSGTGIVFEQRQAGCHIGAAAAFYCIFPEIV